MNKRIFISSRYLLRSQPPFFYRLIDRKTGKEWNISKSLYKFIINHHLKPLPKNNDERVIIENLIKKRVFYLSEHGKKIRYQVIKPYKISFPLELAVIHFTNNCNLNCLHCYFKSIKAEEDLKIEEIESIIKKLVKMNVYKFLITGGEPLMRKDIFKLCRILSRYKVLFSINTNGTLLDRRMLKLLYRCGLRRVKVSLDGISPETHDTLRNKKGVWKVVMRNLKYLKKFREEKKLHWISISTMLTKLNKDEIFEFFDFIVNDLRPDEWILERPLFSGSAKEFWDKIYLPPEDSYEIITKLLKKINEVRPKYPSRIYLDNFYDWYNPKDTASRYAFITLPQFCREHANYLFIAANGDVVLCPCSSPKDENLGKIGNVREERLETLWNKVVKKRLLLSKKLKTCFTCKYLRICGSGCRVRAFQTSNSSLGCDLVVRRLLEIQEKEGRISEME